jgi:hypothetical protein
MLLLKDRPFCERMEGLEWWGWSRLCWTYNMFCFVLIQTLIEAQKAYAGQRKPESRPRGLSHLSRPPSFTFPPFHRTQGKKKKKGKRKSHTKPSPNRLITCTHAHTHTAGHKNIRRLKGMYFAFFFCAGYTSTCMTLPRLCTRDEYD